MFKLIGKLFNFIILIILVPITFLLAIPIGIFKALETKKNRLLFTGIEQSVIAKAQRAINVDKNAILYPDRDIVEVAYCIEKARHDYQQIKSRERFDFTFSEFLKPKIENCLIVNSDNVINYFELSYLLEKEKEIVDKFFEKTYPITSHKK